MHCDVILDLKFLMNPKTKILIVIDWYRPAHKAGGPITSIENLLDLLGDEPHLEFYVVCGVFDYGEQQPLLINRGRVCSRNYYDKKFLHQKPRLA